MLEFNTMNEFTHCVQKKQSFAEWDVNRTAQWLKSLSLYDCIPEEYEFYW